MKSLDKIYGARFFARRHKLHWRAPHVCKAIDDVLQPTSTVDVGCATGDLVKEWRDTFQIPAKGIEGDSSAEKYAVCDILIQDLRILHTPYVSTSGDKFNLCTCLWVRIDM